jgi:hypothetical protein
VEATDRGSVKLALQGSPALGSGPVSYKITGNNVALSGTLRTVGGGGDATGVIAGIPAGSGYTLALDAQIGSTSCSGSATFDVIAAQTSAVSMLLKCRDDQPRGTVAVDGHFDLCPVITAASASPVAVAMGEDIQLNTQASDADGDALRYLWSATGGTLSDANAGDGSFTCQQGGKHTLTVEVRDGSDCASSITIDVQCGQAPPGAVDGGSTDAGAGSSDAGAGPDAGVALDGGADAGAASDAGAGLDAGSAADSGTGDAASGADAGAGGAAVTGTWISQIQTTGAIQAPVVGSVDADIELVTRIVVTGSADALNERLEICRLQTTSTPNASALAVTYPPAAVAALNDARAQPSFVASVGSPFPVPTFTILAGLDASGQAVDADQDGNPGVTLPSNIGGVLAIDAYVGLKMDVSITATLNAPDTLNGTTSFAVSGTVFGSNNPVLSSGSINVVPASTEVPLTARRLDGDVPCSSVVSMFQ